MKKIADISLFESLGNSSVVGGSADMSVFNEEHAALGMAGRYRLLFTWDDEDLSTEFQFDARGKWITLDPPYNGSVTDSVKGVEPDPLEDLDFAKAATAIDKLCHRGFTLDPSECTPEEFLDYVSKQTGIKWRLEH